MKKVLAITIVAILLLCGFFIWYIGKDVPSLKNIKYGPHERNLMDIYLPESADGTPATMFLYIHGGGWTSGDKEGGAVWSHIIVQEGFALVSMNYRFIDPSGNGSVSCEDILDDIHGAIEYLKNNAQAYGIDISGMAIGGYSAGGHLALLYSYSRESPIPIKLVVSEAGLTDFTDPELYSEGVSFLGGPSAAAAIVNALAGTNYSLADLRDVSKDKPELKAISPIFFVTQDSEIPYTILKHGVHDNIIPISESIGLKERIESRGSVCVLITMTNSGHAFENDPEMNESFIQIVVERLHLIVP